MRAPDIIQKCCIISEKALAIFRDAPPKSKVSSAKRAWLIASTPTAAEMPRMIPSTFPADNFLLRESTIRMYKKGDKGHPYRRHLEASKKFVGLPFTNGAIQGLRMQAFIKFKNAELNPKD